MDNKKQNRPNGSDIAADIVSGATAALTYTDEEILATLPPAEAQEFIDLRNRVLADIDSENRYCDNEHGTPLAAEEDAPY